MSADPVKSELIRLLYLDLPLGVPFMWRSKFCSDCVIADIVFVRMLKLPFTVRVHKGIVRRRIDHDFLKFISGYVLVGPEPKAIAPGTM